MRPSAAARWGVGGARASARTSSPARWYTEPAFLEWERAKVFWATWQPVGQSADVAAPGQYFNCEIAGEPIVVVRGKDTPSAPIPSGPKSGTDGAKVTVQRYNFDGNSVRVARLKGPGKTSPALPAVDVLIYVASGRMQITVGDETKVVSAGDVLREEAGKSTFWDVLEPSMFVATNAPTAKP